MIGRDQHLLDHILNLLDVWRAVVKAMGNDFESLNGEQLRFAGIKSAGGFTCTLDRRANFFAVQWDGSAAALDDGGGGKSGRIRHRISRDGSAMSRQGRYARKEMAVRQIDLCKRPAGTPRPWTFN
jgi:hypothetical protein